MHVTVRHKYRDILERFFKAKLSTPIPDLDIVACVAFVLSAIYKENL
jgi:hypothetical protein